LSPPPPPCSPSKESSQKPTISQIASDRSPEISSRMAPLYTPKCLAVDQRSTSSPPNWHPSFSAFQTPFEPPPLPTIHNLHPPTLIFTPENQRLPTPAPPLATLLGSLWFLPQKTWLDSHFS